MVFLQQFDLFRLVYNCSILMSFLIVRMDFQDFKEVFRKMLTADSFWVQCFRFGGVGDIAKIVFLMSVSSFEWSPQIKGDIYVPSLRQFLVLNVQRN